MNIEVSDKPLRWGSLDLSLFGVDHDWQGNKVEPPIAFGIAVDRDYLWFVAAHQKAPQLHPKSLPGKFQNELWKYDVAELFLSDPTTGRYLEFNLAPNSAWWSAEFSAPRIRAEIGEHPFPEVATYADIAADGSWLTAAALPIYQLQHRLNFGPESRLNACFIVNSPEQQFLSAAKLNSPKLDFHLPDQFPAVNFFHNKQDAE
ncbi:hypothetical protein ACFPK9_09450 [Rubritalea spongiae]|uniref:DOMON-like domain-containing protein n=1 Tax=Rubritalea spongiae TaxID=430797 RepID=A0ABW5E4U2_9BACT